MKKQRVKRAIQISTFARTAPFFLVFVVFGIFSLFGILSLESIRDKLEVSYEQKAVGVNLA
jgi:hypothetical protein